jgi:hypothetical protein
MAYAKLKDISPCYPILGVVQKSIICEPNSGCNSQIESYEPRVTLPYDQWRNYVGDGLNTLYAGAVIPGNTFGGTVYQGHVHQGY